MIQIDIFQLSKTSLIEPVLNEKKRLEFTLRVIREHEHYGINQLWNVIKNEYKEPMSRDTVIKTIKILEKKGKIVTIPRGSQSKIVTTDLTLPFYDKEGIKYFSEMFGDFETKIESLLNNWEKMSDVQRAEICVSLIEIISLAEWKFSVFMQKINNPATKKLKKKLLELKEWIYSISSSDPTDEGKIQHGIMTDKNSDSEISKYLRDIEKIYSDLSHS